MKLQKRFNRRVGDREYSKWVVVLPDNEINQLGWRQGIELDVRRTKNGSLELIRSKTEPKKVGAQQYGR